MININYQYFEMEALNYMEQATLRIVETELNTLLKHLHEGTQINPSDYATEEDKKTAKLFNNAINEIRDIFEGK